MSLVVDSSVTLAWCFEDEQSPDAMAVLRRVTETGARVPSHWALEVANGLRTALRRNRITAENRTLRFAMLAKLPIRTDRRTNEIAWTTTVALSDRLGLTVYDAAYLELASRLRLPIATLDQELTRAAQREGIPLLVSTE